MIRKVRTAHNKPFPMLGNCNVDSPAVEKPVSLKMPVISHMAFFQSRWQAAAQLSISWHPHCDAAECTAANRPHCRAGVLWEANVEYYGKLQGLTLQPPQMIWEALPDKC